MMKLNPYSRYQTQMTIEQMFPVRTDGLCACGCNQLLTGRRTRWATKVCADKASERFWIVKGDGRIIRKALIERDDYVCAHCGHKCWDTGFDADHIVPVHRGGGGCDLDNFQTLCPPCHKAKTLRDMGVRKKPSAILSAALSKITTPLC